MATAQDLPSRSRPRALAGRARPVALIALVALCAAAVAGACGGAASQGWTSATPAGDPPVSSSPTPALSDDGASVIAAFIATTQAQDRAMHVDVQGTVTFAGMEETLTAAYDIAGADFAGTTKIVVPDVVTAELAIVVVDGAAFTKANDGAWQVEAVAPPPQDPFAGLGAADVEYVGPEDVAGSAGHRLRLRDPLEAFTRAMRVTSAEGMGDVTVASSTYEVLVDADARPVSATFGLAGTSATAGELEATLAYRFRDWGGTFEIVAPLDLPATPVPGAALTAYNRITEPIVLRDGSGRELPVGACDQASTDAFDADRFDVLLPSGEVIFATYPSPDQGWTARVVIVQANGYQLQPDPVLSELPACEDRSAP